MYGAGSIITQVSPQSRIRRLFVQGACGALVVSGGLSAMPTVASAAPLLANVAPSLVGLRQGSSGADVVTVQRALIAAGISVRGGADGRYGPATRAAVVGFQLKKGLAQSGEIDAATADALGITGGSAPVNPPAPVTPSPVNEYVGLKIGARGALVKVLQEKLIASGTTVRGGADGVFGEATKSAMIAFQRRSSLPDTGVVSQQEVDFLHLGTTTPSVVTPATADEPAVVAPGNPYVGLAVGSSGQLVKEVQLALINAGIIVRGGADGVFGNATQSAVSKFQEENNLGVSGAIYVATAIKLGLGITAPPAVEPTTPPVAPASSNPYVGMAVGNQGPLVKDLQTALMGKGLVVRGGADGSFGNATKSALIAFQKVNALPQTGVVTEQGAQILNLGTPTPDPTPEPSGFAPSPVGFPQKGESSERVRVFQQLLIDYGINVFGGADGSFGNATASAIKKFQQNNGLTVTGTVTQETADKLGLVASDPSAPPTAPSIKLDRFPVQGRCFFGNTWHAARGEGRLHEGTDLIASEGNLLYAVVDGTITKQYWDLPGLRAGNGIRVAQDDGTYFTYLHMSGFAPGIEVGTKVIAGDVIGFVGNTGSSATPHLHFEIHPVGGAAVNPYPYLKAIDDCQNTTPQYQSSFASPQ